METKTFLIPEISDELLAERMQRIKFVVPAMRGVDGKAYSTLETDRRYRSLFYRESLADPRTQSFNFDDDAKIGEEATNLTELMTVDILIEVGGYYGFLKMTMAEVLSQVPEEIVDTVVAFALNPEKEAEVVNNHQHQVVSIIFYGTTDVVQIEELPSSEGLMQPIDRKKVERLKDRVRPFLRYTGEEEFFSLDPSNVDEPFMFYHIWIRVNGSNLHRRSAKTKVTVPCELGKKVTVYYPFTPEGSADAFNPTYAYTISQIPDELITEKTIGLLYHSTNYFKTKEGVLHVVEYTLIEEK